jgi:hypothetical protein
MRERTNQPINRPNPLLPPTRDAPQMLSKSNTLSRLLFTTTSFGSIHGNNSAPRPGSKIPSIHGKHSNPRPTVKPASLVAGW